MNDTDVPIAHDPENRRFEAIVGGQANVVEYRLSDGVMHITHTEVAQAQQGRGIAAALVDAALAHARDNGLKVEPLCRYAAGYMRRHPETSDLLARPPGA